MLFMTHGHLRRDSPRKLANDDSAEHIDNDDGRSDSSQILWRSPFLDEMIKDGVIREGSSKKEG